MKGLDPFLFKGPLPMCLLVPGERGHAHEGVRATCFSFLFMICVTAASADAIGTHKNEFHVVAGVAAGDDDGDGHQS